MADQQILDRDHLARYTLGDAALEQEVLGLFIGQMPETVAMLRGSGSPRAWILAAHTIKGSARAVGAWRLADVAERAESHSECKDQWARLVDEIEGAVGEVRARIGGTVFSAAV